MHDQAGMRIVQTVAGIEHKTDPPLHCRVVVGAPDIQRYAIDAFDHHPGALVGIDTAVQQARNARMLKPRNGLPFLLEQADAVLAQRTEDFQGGILFERAVGATHGIDLAHAAPADQAGDLPGAQTGAGRQTGAARSGVAAVAGQGGGEKTLGRFQTGNQRYRLVQQGLVIARKAARQVTAASRFNFQKTVDKGVEPGPGHDGQSRKTGKVWFCLQ